MKYKIISIKPRSRFVRFFTWSIDYWKVKVKMIDNGNFYTINCWAGICDPSVDNLLWSLNKKIRKMLLLDMREVSFIEKLKKIEGKSIEILTEE